MNKEEIKNKVIQMLMEEELLIELETECNIKEDDNLELYGMDSFAFVKMIVKLEQKFNIEIPNDFLMFEKWGTIKQIVGSLCEIVDNELTS